MSLNHSPAIVTDGLVLCLDAANQRSYPGTGTTWSDRSASGYGGTLANGPTFDADNKGSILFDGTDDYVEIDSGNGFYENLTGATWIIWIKFNSFAYTYNQIFETFPSSGINYQLSGLVKNTGKLAFYAYGTGGSQTNYDGVGLHTLTINKWYQLAYVFKAGQKQEGWVNGVLDGSASSVVSSLVSSQDNVRLSSSSFGTRCVDGYYSSVTCYNRALTADEIRRNYEATVGRYI